MNNRIILEYVYYNNSALRNITYTLEIDIKIFLKNQFLTKLGSLPNVIDENHILYEEITTNDLTLVPRVLYKDPFRPDGSYVVICDVKQNDNILEQDYSNYLSINNNYHVINKFMSYYNICNLSVKSIEYSPDIDDNSRKLITIQSNEPKILTYEPLMLKYILFNL